MTAALEFLAQNQRASHSLRVFRLNALTVDGKSEGSAVWAVRLCLARTKSFRTDRKTGHKGNQYPMHFQMDQTDTLAML